MARSYNNAIFSDQLYHERINSCIRRRMEYLPLSRSSRKLTFEPKHAIHRHLLVHTRLALDSGDNERDMRASWKKIERHNARSFVRYHSFPSPLLHLRAPSSQRGIPFVYRVSRKHGANARRGENTSATRRTSSLSRSIAIERASR